MKKRIALAASIALAISVGGMLPASATKLTAPVVATGGSCARAGSTLDVRVDNADLRVEVVTGALDLTGDVCDADDLLLAGLTAVTIKADDDDPASGDEGDVTFMLESKSTADAIASFAGISWSVQAAGTLKFDATGFSLPTRVVNGVVTEETFTFGTLAGAYYAGKVEFAGGPGAETFDASAVTTTKVTATGNDGADTLKGGALEDTLTGGEGTDKLYGNAGDDKLYIDDSTTDVADQGWGGAGSDAITADAKDTVAPGDGSDAITLATGTTLLYVDSSAAISVNTGTANGVVRSTAGDDYYTSSAYPVIVGSELADTLIGRDGSGNPVTGGIDTFYGGGGADTLVGYSGADVLWGGGGADNIKGGAGDDTVSGDTGADKLNGGSGNDLILMGGGDDIAYGSSGDDVLRGQKGSDQAWGGKGTFDVCAAEVTDHCEFKK